MSGAAAPDGALFRDKAVIGASVAVLVALSWLYLVEMAGAVGPAMTAMAPMRPMDVPALFAMWAVMMVGMMLPSALPMIVLFATVNRKRRAAGAPYVPTAIFVLGYLVAWTAFSAVAAAAQAELHAAALLSPTMTSTSVALGGALFVVAGAYQWTPWKHACLRTCRSPLAFLLNDWREGGWGALRMGLSQGLFCVGCCWFLMGLLFAVGVMNLLWVAAIALFVLGEKLLPCGRLIANASGAALIAAGFVLFERALAG